MNSIHACLWALEVLSIFLFQYEVNEHALVRNLVKIDLSDFFMGIANNSAIYNHLD
jgi:hypothetical protein